MAKYNITGLNYINVGKNRAFVSMDTRRGYFLDEEVYFLSTEHMDNMDIRTESKYNYLITDYIAKEGTDGPLSEEDKRDSIILTEEQSHIGNISSECGDYIRLYLSSSTNDMVYAVRKFNDEATQLNRTFVVEFDDTQKNSLTAVDTAVMKSMYDIVDVSIKSNFDT